MASVLALLFVSGAWAQKPEPSEPPEAVDYQMALQCAGLNLALSGFLQGSNHFKHLHAGQQFEAWAEFVARRDGATQGVAAKDVEVVRRDFVEETGDGEMSARGEKLWAAHGSSLEVCRSVLANEVMRITVGG